MGLCGSKDKLQLSSKLRNKALKIFQKMDVNNSGSIDKQETLKFWSTNFAKLNTQALFNSVDFDKSGEITCDEWLAFWEIVKKSGHTDKEIDNELDNLMEGKAWVQFRKVDEFIKRDSIKLNGKIKEIVGQETKLLSQQQSFQAQRKNSQNNKPMEEEKLENPE